MDLTVTTFVTLDGVMQSPGGAQEDPSGGFAHGGWVAPYFDEAGGARIGEWFGRASELLLGRFTYETFKGYWPGLLQTLLAAPGLVDELRVLTFPVVTGPGKRLFGDGVAPGAWRLTDCTTTATGVVVAVYRPDGPLRSGGFDVHDGESGEAAVADVGGQW